jgi:hypothetical protein
VYPANRKMISLKVSRGLTPEQPKRRLARLHRPYVPLLHQVPPTNNLSISSLSLKATLADGKEGSADETSWA